MDPDIWSNLPNHLVFQHILPLCDIDTRLAFGVKPTKLNIKQYTFLTNLPKPQRSTYDMSQNIIAFYSKVHLKSLCNDYMYTLCSVFYSYNIKDISFYCYTSSVENKLGNMYFYDETRRKRRWWYKQGGKN